MRNHPAFRLHPRRKVKCSHGDAAQRAFPGGKIHPGETPEECLRRELLEELGIVACIGGPLPPSTYRYPAFTITLYPFLCTVESGELVPREHEQIAWLTPEELPHLDWAEADHPIVDALK